MAFRTVAFVWIVFWGPAVVWTADQEREIATSIARLGSENQAERAAAMKTLVALGKPAGPALVQALGDARNDVRALAAEALRGLLAADPANAPNCHEKAFWQARVDQLKPGMTLDEALKLLLPELSPEERRKRWESGKWSGNSGVREYRLDDYWVVCLHLIDHNREKLHPDAPAAELSRRTNYVYAEPPAKFTGTWTNWYVDGRKFREDHFDRGKLTEKSQWWDERGKAHPAIQAAGR